MGYIKYELPATLGRIVDQGTRFLGIKLKRNRGRFVLYDLQMKNLIETLAMSKCDFDLYDRVDEFAAAKAIGDNGAYFLTEYEIDEDGDMQSCHVEVYDQTSLQKVTSIPISDVKGNWLEECMMAEAAKLTEDDYLLVYYDHEKGMNVVVEVCHYNTISKKFTLLKRLQVDGAQWRNIIFDRDWMMLTMDSFSDSMQTYMTEQDGGITYRFRLSNNFTRLTEIEDEKEERIDFEDRTEGLGKSIRRYYIGVELQQGRKGLLGKEYAKLVDCATKKELMDFTTNRNQTEWYEVLPELNLVVGGIVNYKEDIQRIFVFEKSAGRFVKVDEFDIDPLAFAFYDKVNQLMQIQSQGGTVLIKVE